MNNLRAEHLAKRYGARQVVIDLSLELRAGEIVGLLGPNGAGKTTAFYMIVGLVPPDGGRIFLDDLDLTDAPIHRRALAGIGYLPQEPSVFRRLTVEQNIMAILETRPGLDRAARETRREELLADLRIEQCGARRGSRCPVANGDASKSRAHSPPNPASCCSTSRSPASIRSP